MIWIFCLDATPAAFSEDSQEAMNNSNSKEQPSKNITNAEVAEKNLPDLTGENWFAVFYLAKKYFVKKYPLSRNWGHILGTLPSF